MPFKSDAQRRYLYAKEPAVAKEFASHTPKGKKLPEHVKKPKQQEKKAGIADRLRAVLGSPLAAVGTRVAEGASALGARLPQLHIERGALKPMATAIAHTPSHTFDALEGKARDAAVLGAHRNTVQRTMESPHGQRAMELSRRQAAAQVGGAAALGAGALGGAAGMISPAELDRTEAEKAGSVLGTAKAIGKGTLTGAKHLGAGAAGLGLGVAAGSATSAAANPNRGAPDGLDKESSSKGNSMNKRAVDMSSLFSKIQGLASRGAGKVNQGLTTLGGHTMNAAEGIGFKPVGTYVASGDVAGASNRLRNVGAGVAGAGALGLAGVNHMMGGAPQEEPKVAMMMTPGLHALGAGNVAAAGNAAKPAVAVKPKASSGEKKAELIGTPFMDGFLQNCIDNELNGEQVADLLEKGAAVVGAKDTIEDRLATECRGFIDRMAIA